MFSSGCEADEISQSEPPRHVAVFHRSGRTPSLSELLKIAVLGAANICVVSQYPRGGGGVLSGPVALLHFTFVSAVSVLATLPMSSPGIGSRMTYNTILYSYLSLVT